MTPDARRAGPARRDRAADPRPYRGGPTDRPFRPSIPPSRGPATASPSSTWALEPNDFAGTLGPFRYQFEGEEDLLHLMVTADGAPLSVADAQRVVAFRARGRLPRARLAQARRALAALLRGPRRPRGLARGLGEYPLARDLPRAGTAVRPRRHPHRLVARRRPGVGAVRLPTRLHARLRAGTDPRATLDRLDPRAPTRRSTPKPRTAGFGASRARTRRASSPSPARGRSSRPFRSTAGASSPPGPPTSPARGSRRWGCRSPASPCSGRTSSGGSPRPIPSSSARPGWASRPQDCLGFEDTDAGLQSIRAAGACPIAVGRGPLPDLTGVRLVVRHDGLDLDLPDGAALPLHP